MTNTEIIRQRLQNQHLVTGWLTQPAALVQWLGAVQAQDYAGAKWALGARLPGTTDDDVERAFTDGTILRTHVLRPTWHFVAPADIRWMLKLTAPRVHALLAPYNRKHELDAQTLRRSVQVLTKALQGGRQLTRDELRAVFAASGIAAEDTVRMAHLMMHAELEGVVCSGARRGKQFTYALLDERVPPTPTLTREEALCELVRRYFVSHGPATLQDFAWWSGLTLTDARRGVAALPSELQHVTYKAQTYWLASSAPIAKATIPAAYLLPNYDEYGIAYRDRSAIFHVEHASQLIFNHLIFLKGQLVGTWKRTLRKDAVVLETNTFTPLTKAETQAVTAAAQQYGNFLGLPVVIA